MNAKKLIASFAVLAASASAFAGENIEAVDQSNFVSTKTRAEVRAELDQAYAQGFHPGSTEVVEFTNVASTRTRDEVRQELSQSANDLRTSSLYLGD
jgi:hypothetical protein